MDVSRLFRFRRENGLKTKRGIGAMLLAACLALSACAGHDSREGAPNDVYGRGGWGNPVDPYGPYSPGPYGYYGPYGPYGGWGYSGWWGPPVYPVYWVYPQAEPAPVPGGKARPVRVLRLQERMLDVPEFRLPPVRIAPPPAVGSGGWLRRSPPLTVERSRPEPLRLPSHVPPVPARLAPITPPMVVIPPVRASRPQAEPAVERPPPRRIFRRPGLDE